MNRSIRDDIHGMRLALRQAHRALGRTSPNPAVGAVIADSQGRVVGVGYTQPPGGPHAEVGALQEAGEAARGGTLYVTLEPCSHFGRTPPCADAILTAGIRRVVCAHVDPNPQVAGNGIRRLREGSVEVHVGILAEEAAQINAAWLTFIQHGRPYTHLKSAMTLDGKIATHTGDSRWISSEVSRAWVHRQRQHADAVLVGIGTALQDDPQLTPRPRGRARPGFPARIVVDTHARLPLDSRLFADIPDFPLIVAVGVNAPEERVRQLQERGAEIIVSPEEDGHVFFPVLFRKLAAQSITSILLEGGGELAAAALKAGIIDRVTMFIAPVLVGGRDAKSPIEGDGVESIQLGTRLHNVKTHRCGPDLRMDGEIHSVQIPTLDGI